MASVVSPVCDHASDDVFSNLPENIATHLSANGYVICDNAIDNIFLKAVIQDTIGVEKHMKDGEILEDSLHAGLPVIEGFKWILIVWVRENKFII